MVIINIKWVKIVNNEEILVISNLEFIPTANIGKLYNKIAFNIIRTILQF
jgi:hypothetical protein